MQVGLVGATNVGKSTLFNRLIGQFRAIVTDIPGTTKDIIYHNINTDKGVLKIADSPGLSTFEEEIPFIQKIIENSDLIIFVIDYKIGRTAKEQQIYEMIQKQGKIKQTALVINKVDKPTTYDDEIIIQSEYLKYNFKQYFVVSASQGKNLTLLKNFVVDFFEINNFLQEEEFRSFGFAILGKPNSGKSTLFNKIIGDQISKVEDKPGTTLDYVQYEVNYKGQKFNIYDTAGIRKKGKIHGLENIAYQKTMTMLKYIRPAVFYLVDGTIGLTHRDKTLLEEIHRIALPIVIGVNKIDVIDNYNKVLERVEDHLPFLKNYISIIPISAKKGINIDKAIKLLQKAYKSSFIEIKTSKLNEIINKEYLTRPPRFPKNKICKIFYITQVSINPIKFKVFINYKKRANFSFKRWIENVLRKYFDFYGNPIILEFIEREQKK